MALTSLSSTKRLFASAMANAESVAERISRGIFWPPGEVEFDDFASLFLGEDPDEIISEKSKEFLSGRVLIDSPLCPNLARGGIRSGNVSSRRRRAPMDIA